MYFIKYFIAPYRIDLILSYAPSVNLSSSIFLSLFSLHSSFSLYSFTLPSSLYLLSLPLSRTPLSLHPTLSLFLPLFLHSPFITIFFLSLRVDTTTSNTTSENQEAEDVLQDTAENAEIEVENEVEKEVVMSDLDMMLLSVGEELKSTTKPVKITEINQKEKDKMKNLSTVPGGLWTSGTGRRRRCGHTVGKHKIGGVCGIECDGDNNNNNDIEYSGEGNNGNGNSKERGSNGNSIMEVERNEMREEVLKKMKNGMLDPSKGLPSDAISLAKNIFNDNNNNNNNSNSDEKASSILRLKRLLSLLERADNTRINEKGEKEKLFESVKLNSDNTKLIFRSNDNNGNEAFCFFVWGNNDNKDKNENGNGDNNEDKNNNDNENGNENKNENENGNHNAVVQSSSESFRKTVIQALKSII
jgi:hypothetical protein